METNDALENLYKAFCFVGLHAVFSDGEINSSEVNCVKETAENHSLFTSLSKELKEKILLQCTDDFTKSSNAAIEFYIKMFLASKKVMENFDTTVIAFVAKILVSDGDFADEEKKFLFILAKALGNSEDVSKLMVKYVEDELLPSFSKKESTENQIASSETNDGLENLYKAFCFVGLHAVYSDGGKINSGKINWVKKIAENHSLFTSLSKDLKGKIFLQCTDDFTESSIEFYIKMFLASKNTMENFDKTVIVFVAEVLLSYGYFANEKREFLFILAKSLGNSEDDSKLMIPDAFKDAFKNRSRRQVKFFFCTLLVGMVIAMVALPVTISYETKKSSQHRVQKYSYAKSNSSSSSSSDTSDSLSKVFIGTSSNTSSSSSSNSSSSSSNVYVGTWVCKTSNFSGLTLKIYSNGTFSTFHSGGSGTWTLGNSGSIKFESSSGKRWSAAYLNGNLKEFTADGGVLNYRRK